MIIFNAIQKSYLLIQTIKSRNLSDVCLLELRGLNVLEDMFYCICSHYPNTSGSCAQLSLILGLISEVSANPVNWIVITTMLVNGYLHMASSL